jgi:hypothetical protein
MRMNYSEKHIAAFNRWKSVGSLNLTDAEVAALARGPRTRRPRSHTAVRARSRTRGEGRG